MSDSPHSAYRHFYTVAVEGSLGHPGFQTVACAPALEPVLAELERRVGGFKNPDGRDDGAPSRQLARMGDPDFYALTTFTPLGQGPDGRDGNYFAETLVVPAAWLADGDWDAAAAFACLVWRGPAAAAECSGWPCPLEDLVPLPVLQPTPFPRLARLREGVPRELLAPLVAAVARLTRRRQPVRLVEAAGGGPVPLGELVELLPLMLPPACRSFEDGDARRTFQLCTRSHPDAPFAVDLCGVPSRHLDAAAAGSDFVVDLGERQPPETVRERFAKDYAAWFQEMLTGGDWQRLAELWRRAEATPGAAFFAAFPTLLEDLEAERDAAAAAPALGGDALQPASASAAQASDDDDGAAADSLVGRRRAVWTTQAQVEAFLARQHAERQGELKELLGLLREDAAGSQARLLDTLTREREETARRLSSERQALSEAMRDERERMAVELRRSVEGVGRDALESLRREASSIRGAARSELEKTILELQQALARQRAPAGAPAGVARGGRTWQAAAALSLLVVFVAIAAVFVFYGMPGAGDGAGSGAQGGAAQSAIGDGTQTGAAAVEDGSAADLAALAARGPVAAALLARATDPRAEPAVDAATRDAAAALYLDLRLDDDPPRNDGLRVRLMQAALGVGVDGDPGPGTRAALDGAVAGTCCAGLSEQGRAHCFLARRLELDEDPCSGAVLFAAGADWSFGEASRLLALIRETVAAMPASSTYRDLLQDLDLAAAPGTAARRTAAVAGLTPDGAETASLLHLARAVASGRTWDDVSGQPGDAERRQVAALLRGLAADGTGAAS